MKNKQKAFKKTHSIKKKEARGKFNSIDCKQKKRKKKGKGE